MKTNKEIRDKAKELLEKNKKSEDALKEMTTLNTEMSTKSGAEVTQLQKKYK